MRGQQPSLPSLTSWPAAFSSVVSAPWRKGCQENITANLSHVMTERERAPRTQRGDSPFVIVVWVKCQHLLFPSLFLALSLSFFLSHTHLITSAFALRSLGLHIMNLLNSRYRLLLSSLLPALPIRHLLILNSWSKNP